MDEKIETLQVRAEDGIKTKDAFGNLGQQMQGIGGTLYITKQDDLINIPKLAWDLSQQTRKPVIVVVRNT